MAPSTPRRAHTLRRLGRRTADPPLSVLDVALRLDNSHIVHLAGTATDHRGETLPAPACHVGVAGWDPRRLHVSEAPVTCRRCLHLLEARQIPAVPLQEPLF